ncbi:TrmB family transcriptional regulator, partial [Candidatus Woesearchaeota archaeon]|nr:TrmB family transcriptional regulator [Candidatus Woesearchaeota archaeon]
MEEELREFGLTDKEIQVYLACLKLGSALVQDIAKAAGTYRTYTYEILKSLKEKGLVSYVIRSGKQYFEVAEPDKLLSILKEKEAKINNIMPQLKGI